MLHGPQSAPYGNHFCNPSPGWPSAPSHRTRERSALTQGQCFREQATAPSSEHSFQIGVQQHQKKPPKLNAAEIQPTRNVSLFYSTSFNSGEWRGSGSRCSAKSLSVNCSCSDQNLSYVQNGNKFNLVEIKTMK